MLYIYTDKPRSTFMRYVMVLPLFFQILILQPSIGLKYAAKWAMQPKRTGFR